MLDGVVNGMLSNLGTRLFKSVTDKAGDLGEKFEEEFSRLSNNFTAELDTVVTEAVSLSMFIKVTLVFLCILLATSTLAVCKRCIFNNNTPNRSSFRLNMPFFRNSRVAANQRADIPLKGEPRMKSAQLFPTPPPRTNGVQY